MVCKVRSLLLSAVLGATASLAQVPQTSGAPKVPRFSVEYLDRSVDPSVDFYRFATGSWVRDNPVPSDKSRWSGFDELQDRNWKLIRELLDEAGAGKLNGKPARQVGAFFRSAMDTNRIERLRFRPIEKDLARIRTVKDVDAYFRLLAELQERGVGALFGGGVIPDARNSSVYQLKIGQGGLGLPDRDYYLSDGFAKQRDAYRAHVIRMLSLLGDSTADATARAATILELETELARAGKSRTELRDPNANYNKLSLAELRTRYPHVPWNTYLAGRVIGPDGRLYPVLQDGFVVTIAVPAKEEQP